jgi:cyclohexa-1,5-dienecarbonyl-CoA hydratase
MNRSFITLNRRASRAELILNRPPRNLLNVEVLEQFVNSLKQLRDDESLKILVLRGSASVFCSGIEVTERASDRAGLMMPLFTEIFDFLNQIRGLTVSVVEGEAHDGGFELAAFCDVVFAADNATFQHPEINYGLFPPIAAAVLPRLVGRNRALEWMMSGDVITAQEAYEAGLINRLWHHDRVNAELEKFVNKIDSLSAPAVVWTKRAVDRSFYAPVMEGMRISESIYMLELMRNLDPHEGIKAAVEGRPPRWRNV